MIDKGNISRIVIRVPNWMGDILLATPAISLLRRMFPDSTISALMKSEMIPVLEGNSDIDDIVSFPQARMSPFSRLSFYRSLKSRKFDLAVLFTNSFESALAARLFSAKEIIGYRRDFRSFFLTSGITPPPRTPPRIHQTDYYINLVMSIIPKHNMVGYNAKKVLFNIPRDVQESVDCIWKREGLGSVPVVGFAPGASFGTAKRWLPERFSILGNKIVKEYNAKVVVFGSSKDIDVANKIVDGIKYGAISMAGKTTIKSLGSMIQRCHLFITNDSGPMHIAAAVGTPIVAIFGSTDSSETCPLSDSFFIVKNESACSPCWKRECPIDHNCMESISVDKVMNKVKIFFEV